MYVESPFLESPRFHRIFRKRFRMPYRCFQELAAMLAESPLFERWRDGKADAFDRPTTPLPLLVLCCLRYIGRGWTFDDLSENTGISDEIIRVFFHRFVEFGSTVLYKKHVVAPESADDAAVHTKEYEKLDYRVVLARWMRRTYSLKRLSIGFVRVTSDSRAVTLVVLTTSL
jgi:hypothetical protein